MATLATLWLTIISGSRSKGITAAAVGKPGNTVSASAAAVATATSTLVAPLKTNASTTGATKGTTSTTAGTAASACVAEQEALRVSINLTTSTLAQVLEKIHSHFAWTPKIRGFEYFDDQSEFVWVSTELEFVAFLKLLTQFPWKSVVYLQPTPTEKDLRVDLCQVADRYKETILPVVEKDKDKEKESRRASAVAGILSVPLVDDFDWNETGDMETAWKDVETETSHILFPLTSPEHDDKKSPPPLTTSQISCTCTLRLSSNFCRCFQADIVTLTPKVLAQDVQRYIVGWKWKNTGTSTWPVTSTLQCLSSRGAEVRVRMPTVWTPKMADWISIELSVGTLPLYERELYFQLAYLYEAVETGQPYSWRLQKRFGPKLSMPNPFYLAPTLSTAVPIPLLGRLKSWF